MTKESRISNITVISDTLRDLIIRFLPSKFVKATMGTGEFAFLAHPLETSDIHKKYSFAENWPPSRVERLTRHLWPITGGQITGLKKKSGAQIKGWIVICPLTAKQMLENPRMAEKRILQTIRLAEKLGAKIIGLGAFSSIVTKGGLSLVGRTRAGLTTGNAFAAALAVQNAIKVTALLGLNMKELAFAVVGAAGSVGSACSEFLVDKVGRLVLVDRDAVALKNLSEKIRNNNEVVASTELYTVRQARIIIAVTSTAEGIIKSDYLGPGTVVIDAAQPHNVCKDVLKREDVIVINSGIAKAPGVSCDMDIGLQEEEVYACLAEVLMLIWKGHEGHYSLGRVNPQFVREVLEEAAEVGLYPAELRSPLGFINSENIGKVRAYFEAKQHDQTSH